MAFILLAITFLTHLEFEAYLRFPVMLVDCASVQVV